MNNMVQGLLESYGIPQIGCEMAGINACYLQIVVVDISLQFCRFVPVALGDVLHPK
jgi:hypothetical protein